MGRPRKYVKAEPKPFNFLITVVRGSKVIEQLECSWINEAYAYKFKREREEGVKVEIRRLQNIPRDIKLRKKRGPREKKGWAESVRCRENGREFACVRDCERAMGVSGYRIRSGADSGKDVDGYHFEWINKRH